MPSQTTRITSVSYSRLTGQSPTPFTLGQFLCYHSPVCAFSVSFSNHFSFCFFLNIGISLRSLLNSLLLLCAQCLSDFINTNDFNYLLCAYGSQVVSWLHSHTSNCLQESTVWMSLGHCKLRMLITNSPSFFQPLLPPPKFSVSMKGSASTQQSKVRNLEIVGHWNISLSCQIHLLTSPTIRSFA